MNKANLKEILNAGGAVPVAVGINDKRDRFILSPLFGSIKLLIHFPPEEGEPTFQLSEELRGATLTKDVTQEVARLLIAGLDIAKQYRTKKDRDQIKSERDSL